MFCSSIFYVLLGCFYGSFRADGLGFGGFWWATSLTPGCCLLAVFLDLLWLFDCFEFDLERDLDFVLDCFDFDLLLLLDFDLDLLFDVETFRALL